MLRTEHSKKWEYILEGKFVDKPSKEEINFINQEQQYFKDHLKGQSLIDLGGGCGFTMAKFANFCEVKTYINVDIEDLRKDEREKVLSTSFLMPKMPIFEYKIRDNFCNRNRS